MDVWDTHMTGPSCSAMMNHLNGGQTLTTGTLHRANNARALKHPGPSRSASRRQAGDQMHAHAYVIATQERFCITGHKSLPKHASLCQATSRNVHWRSSRAASPRGLPRMFA